MSSVTGRQTPFSGYPRQITNRSRFCKTPDQTFHMKILIADSFPASHIDRLTRLGHEVNSNPALDGAALPQAVLDHSVLVVRSTQVTANTLASGKSLKLVVRAGAGTNTIDKSGAADRGIRVCNVPGANSIAVAELVIGLIIAIDRNIAAAAADLKNRVWNKKKYSTGRGLYGRKIGILGLGAIGFAVAERARAFGMGVHAIAKPGRSDQASARIAKAGIIQLDSQDELLETCDIVTLHMPSTDSARNMVNHSFLGKMKNGATLINTSRGDLIDEAALIEAMQSKGIRAGLDVYRNEPDSASAAFESALANHESVCGTHHIGASTTQAQTAVANGVIDVIDSFVNGKLINCVN